MGLFDDVVGSLLSGDAGKYQAILSWVNEQGEYRRFWRNCKAAGWVTLSHPG